MIRFTSLILLVAHAVKSAAQSSIEAVPVPGAPDGIGGGGGGDNDGSIVGGFEITSVPAYAIPDLNDSDFLCGGTLIGHDIVLTAAHCQNAFAAGVNVFFGATIINGFDAIDAIGIEQVFPHPDYDDVAFANDIMLVKLLEGSNVVTPVIYNTDPSEPQDNDRVATIGFGLTAFEGDISATLRGVELGVVNSETCAAAYADIPDTAFSGDIMMCAADGDGKGSCQGDS